MLITTTAPRHCVTTRWSDRGVLAVFAAAGEIDASNGPGFADLLAVELASKPDVLIVDLSEVDFCSSSAASALLRASGDAHERRIGFAVASSQRAVRRLVDILGLRTLIPLYPTVEAALNDSARHTPAKATVPEGVSPRHRAGYP